MTYTPTTRTAKITKKLVDKLQPGETVMDGGYVGALRGFGVRRQKSEDRVYFVRKHAKGKRQYVTIGAHGAPWTVETARDEAAKLNGYLKSGLDPHLSRMQARDTPMLAAYCRERLDTNARHIKASTLVTYRSSLDTHLERDIIGRTRMDLVTHAQVERLHSAVAKKHPHAARTLMFLISRTYTEAAREGLISPAVNPAKGIELHPRTKDKRERFLSTDELERVGKALVELEQDGTNLYIVATIRLLIFTGCRKSEFLGLRWEWIDFERSMLNLPDTKTGARTIHLNPEALSVLKALPRIKGRPFVINDGRSRINLTKVWAKVVERAELAPSLAANGKMKPVRIHDLRHTFASLAIANGAHLVVVQQLLGHANIRTTIRYAHLADTQIKSATAAIGSAIGAKILPPGSTS